MSHMYLSCYSTTDVLRNVEEKTRTFDLQEIWFFREEIEICVPGAYCLILIKTACHKAKHKIFGGSIDIIKLN